MRIIVTGAAGFLGRHLCRALVGAGHQLKLIDLRPNPEFPTLIADIRDGEIMKKEIRDADAVFHLAALIEAGESVKHPGKFIDYNITGSLHVLEAMRQNGVKIFIFSSSAAIYGEPQRTPIKEDDRTIPINPYGMTKLAMEGLLASYVTNYGLTGIALRYFNLYGPGELHQPETHAIPRFIRQMLHQEEVTIWGKGEHQRDFIFIEDVVSAHLTALDLAIKQPGRYHYFNLSTNQPTTVKEIIDILEHLTGQPARLAYHDYRPGDPLVLTADSTKAHAQMGWQAKMGLEEGLRLTIEFFQNSPT